MSINRAPTALLEFNLLKPDQAIHELDIQHRVARQSCTGARPSVPQACAELVLGDNFSIMLGKLPALSGLQETFTFRRIRRH